VLINHILVSQYSFVLRSETSVFCIIAICRFFSLNATCRSFRFVLQNLQQIHCKWSKPKKFSVKKKGGNRIKQATPKEYAARKHTIVHGGKKDLLRYHQVSNSRAESGSGKHNVTLCERKEPSLKGGRPPPLVLKSPTKLICLKKRYTFRNERVLQSLHENTCIRFTYEIAYSSLSLNSEIV
jgi:hypothetical protein